MRGTTADLGGEEGWAQRRLGVGCERQQTETAVVADTHTHRGQTGKRRCANRRDGLADIHNEPPLSPRVQQATQLSHTTRLSTRAHTHHALRRPGPRFALIDFRWRATGLSHLAAERRAAPPTTSRHLPQVKTVAPGNFGDLQDSIRLSGTASGRPYVDQRETASGTALRSFACFGPLHFPLPSLP